MRTRSAFLSLLALLLSACTVRVPNIRVCAVAGTLSGGADCAFTLDTKTEEMNLDQFIAFLEPQLDPPRGAAMCMSSEEFEKVKTFIEQACRKMGTACTKEAKENLQIVSANLGGLQERVRKKKKPLRVPIVR